MLTYGSVCSGIEAASVAWEPLGWRPAFFAEIEAFPSAVLAHHYGSNMPGEPLSRNGVPNHGDFTQIPVGAGPVDLLVGGTPCQSFSVAGKRLGLDDPRGNLALEYVRLAKRLGARWVVWENVPGVLSSAGGRDFADFLGFLAGRRITVPRGGWQNAGIVAGVPGAYGLAWHVLDAQFVRVDGFARAVPQRRRRVFVVGYIGDWRRAAAVLFEPEGMQGHPPPRREARENVAGTITGSAGRRGGQPSGGEIEGHLITAAFGGGNTSGSIDVSTALTAHGVRQDFEVETFVAHTLRGEGFDASEDGTGRGPPLVAVPETAATLTRGAESAGKGGYAGRRQDDDENLVAFALQERMTSLNPDNGPNGKGWSDDGSAFTLEARQTPQAVAFSAMPMNSGKDFTVRETDVAQPLMAAGVQLGDQGGDMLVTSMAVRRLMPHECARASPTIDVVSPGAARRRPTGRNTRPTAIPWRCPSCAGSASAST